ncbi:MAG: site-specific integrase [Rhodopila sp.]|jgi:integrase
MQRVLGSADDLTPADGDRTLNYAQALTRAQQWFVVIEASCGTKPDTPLTIVRAMEDYLAAYEAKGGKHGKRMRQLIAAHILPVFGAQLVKDLTARAIATWRDSLATAPARLRTKSGQPQQTREATTSAAQRARRATANRVLTILKAALNHAWETGAVPSDEAWRRVSPFEKVDAPRVRWLEDEEAVRLVEASPADLRQMVVASLLTGGDYSELANARVRDLHLDTATLTVTGKRHERVIRLSAEALVHFRAAAAGKSPSDLLFPRADGDRWGDTEQSRPIQAACDAAKIKPAIGFHILRHTYASRMLRRGMAMHLVSRQLGHKSIKTTEKYYAHIAPDNVAKAVAEHSGRYGF